MILAVVIFVAALAVIFTEKVHRTKVALIAAALVILTGTLTQEKAIEAIDFNTIGLLAGMMIVVRQTEKSGLFNYVAIRAGQFSRGRSLRLMVYLCFITAVLSALLDNLTTILLVVPITFLLADTLDLPPLPLIIAEVMASNIGGTATLIGDPPNILIAGATGLSFVEFLTNLGPIAAIALVLVVLGLYGFYRKKLQVHPAKLESLMALDARASIHDSRLLKMQLPVLGLILLGFFLHGALGLEPATIALTGAAVLLLMSTQPIEQALEEVEWPTLFFFLGLFVIVGGLEATGALSEVARGITDLTKGDFTATILGITWVSAFASSAVDNIPFTATMIPVIQEVQEISGNKSDTFWWALALASGFGGNGTLIAAAANVAAAGLSERAGHPISFVSFLKIGLPVMIGSTALASVYLYLRYLM